MLRRPFPSAFFPHAVCKPFASFHLFSCSGDSRTLVCIANGMRQVTAGIRNGHFIKLEGRRVKGAKCLLNCSSCDVRVYSCFLSIVVIVPSSVRFSALRTFVSSGAVYVPSRTPLPLSLPAIIMRPPILIRCAAIQAMFANASLYPLPSPFAPFPP
ncbi:hypothetical protein OBBRIDRAFT_350724 [Obba rivulosa]|uniref:Uncharacterized protein n=1 Tax=Obba rivulosa TaxID=1052685 RepID=A0A8E2DP62_9APHY|nr:hypothetical protein OBBRIDRAFT_350724 [Obba rivulosa]